MQVKKLKLQRHPNLASSTECSIFWQPCNMYVDSKPHRANTLNPNQIKWESNY